MQLVRSTQKTNPCKTDWPQARRSRIATAVRIDARGRDCAPHRCGPSQGSAVPEP